MLDILPVLAEFPLCGVHLFMDLYTIFRFEPMRTPSSGISRLLKECVVIYFEDDSLKTGFAKTGRFAISSYRQIRKMVQPCLNLFSKDARTSSPASDSKVYFSLSGDCSGNSRIFSESGFAEMLAVSDFDTPDRVSSFLGVIIDGFRGMGNSAKVTDMFTQYVNVVNVLFRRDCKRFSTSAEIFNFPKMIKRFESELKEVLGAHHLRRGLKKMACKRSVCRCTSHDGVIAYLHDGHFESAHRNFKRHC